MKLKFGQYFAADVWLKIEVGILLKILQLGLVKILKIKFSRNAEVDARLIFRG